MQRIPMTPEGHRALQDELQRLIQQERPRVIRAIEEARAHGDLSENAEYHAAKEEQGLIEARILFLEQRLSQAQVIDVTTMTNEGRIIFGATVTLTHCEEGHERTYRIVGEEQANIDEGLLSISSPMSRAMIGKHAGDIVDVQTPSGTQSYEVLKVDYC